ncbi:Pentatricopeptide repeat-containing protein [Balamuthia mandrillaris]
MECHDASVHTMWGWAGGLAAVPTDAGGRHGNGRLHLRYGAEDLWDEEGHGDGEVHHHDCRAWAAWTRQSRLAALQEMEEHGVEPNAITFINVLNACSHAGLVEEGLACFAAMRERSTTSSPPRSISLAWGTCWGGQHLRQRQGDGKRWRRSGR